MKMHRFGSNSPSEKLQIKILLIDTPQTVLIMFTIQIFRKRGPERDAFGVFSQALDQTQEPRQRFSRQKTPSARVELAVFLRNGSTSPHPHPQTQTHPGPANEQSGLSEHPAARSVLITLMMINERLDNLISRVITL